MEKATERQCTCCLADPVLVRDLQQAVSMLHYLVQQLEDERDYLQQRLLAVTSKAVVQ